MNYNEAIYGIMFEFVRVGFTGANLRKYSVREVVIIIELKLRQVQSHILRMQI